MLLTHSSGFANFSFFEPDGKLRFHFDPGTRYAYSGEGIILLQFALEQGLGLDVGAEMQRRVFDRFGMTRTSLSWRPDFARNLADGWNAERPARAARRARPGPRRGLDGHQHRRFRPLRRRLHAAARGSSRRRAPKCSAPSSPITTRSQFPTLQPEAPAERRWPGLAAGLGLITVRRAAGPRLSSTAATTTPPPISGCVSSAAAAASSSSPTTSAPKRAFPALVDSILGETGLPWRWEYGE